MIIQTDTIKYKRYYYKSFGRQCKTSLWFQDPITQQGAIVSWKQIWASVFETYVFPHGIGF